MTGIIAMTTIRGRMGGEIRADGFADRISFAVTELDGLTTGDCLGLAVAFDVLDGHAVRVRPVRQAGAA